MPELPAPAPEPNAETAPFWAATAEQRLLLRQCRACKTVNWYPRQICPECSSTDTEWIEASGRGIVYSFTHNYRGSGPYRDHEYLLAYVELDEGPRVMTNLVEVDPAAISIGTPVEVVFHDTGAGSALYRFRPIARDASA